MYPQRCSDPRPHSPHRVPRRGDWTAFTCDGRLVEPADLPPADCEGLIPAP